MFASASVLIISWGMGVGENFANAGGNEKHGIRPAYRIVFVEHQGLDGNIFII
jgi:hypothetical protein